eukprot:CAMPEP_0172588444 /NCGR_PEP_ID=MMETSP1068-20121228/7345_1 /TAXON_ID=35684 /ORGANISM="Pseudopedinella elastica, Strain CCMP716" /LENGTH=410 /DNA_ID=CAMNT_0013383765 /DNA_START=105 /DNA_END=1337 /DNA_ORIENTATION=-
MLPVTRTKAGPGEKEPAYIILQGHVRKFLALLIFVALLLILKFYDSANQFDKIKLKLHGVARNLHLVEREHRTAHAEMAKVGEEFEVHLDRDLKELEAGQHLITSFKTTHKEFQERVHGIVAATFAQHSQPKLPEAQEHANLQADLQSQLDTAIRDLFDNQSKSVRALVRRLAEGAKEASERREDLQEEILHNLEETNEEEEETGIPDDPWWKENGEGGEEDDHWAKETERWHNETVEAFFSNLDSWLHPDLSAPKNESESVARPRHHAPKASYDNSTSLYKALKEAHAHLDEEVAKWHDVQDLIHSRAKEIAAYDLPAYTDADEPEDDGYQGFQSWHVQSYLSDLLWPAHLRAHLPLVERARLKLGRGELKPVDVVETLEELAAENVIPHHWLHHGGHEYYYGGRDDMF